MNKDILDVDILNVEIVSSETPTNELWYSLITPTGVQTYLAYKFKPRTNIKRQLSTDYTGESYND